MAVLTDRVNLLQGRLLNGRPIFLLDNSCRVWTSSIFADGTPEDVLVPENVKSVYGVDCEVTTFEGHPHLMFCDTDEDPIAEVPDWMTVTMKAGMDPLQTISKPFPAPGARVSPHRSVHSIGNGSSNLYSFEFNASSEASCLLTERISMGTVMCP